MKNIIVPQREIIGPWPNIIVPNRIRLPRLPRIAWEFTPPTYRNSTNGVGQTSATLTVNKASGTVDNDGMIVAIFCERNGGIPENLAITPPAGWTLVRRTNNTGVTAGLVVATYRKVASGEGASWDWTVDNQIDYNYQMISYSGIDTSAFVNAENGQLNADGTNIAAPSVTTTVADCMLLYVGGAIRDTNATGAPTLTVPGTMTQRQNVVLGGAFVWYLCGMLAEEAQAAIGASGTRTGTISAASTTGNIGHLLALAPSAGAAAVLAFKSHSMHPGKSPGYS